MGLFELNENENLTSGGALIEKYASLNQTVDSNLNHLLMSTIKGYCSKNKNCDFSFSGILASNLRLIEKLYNSEENTETKILNDVEKKVLKFELITSLCNLTQFTVAYQLKDRLKRALNYLTKYRQIKLNGVVVSGGVASNLFIRNSLSEVIQKHGLRASYPPVKYCTDNGVMIAWNGCEKFINNNHREIFTVDRQDKQFYDNIMKPKPKCPFGEDISDKIKLLNLRN